MLRSLKTPRRFFQRHGSIGWLPVAYILVAWGYWGLHRSELYPFAPWSMFNDVPNAVTQYTIQLVDENNEGIQTTRAEFEPFWHRLPDGIKNVPVDVYRAQTHLGRAIESQDNNAGAKAVNIIRPYLQRQFTTGVAKLTRRTFDPAEMYRHGTESEQVDLLRFSF